MRINTDGYKVHEGIKVISRVDYRAVFEKVVPHIKTVVKQLKSNVYVVEKWKYNQNNNMWTPFLNYCRLDKDGVVTVGNVYISRDLDELFDTLISFSGFVEGEGTNEETIQ